MASPTFSASTLFASSSGVTEGTLRVLGFTPIIQRIHFNGAASDVYLTHGFPDRPWIFQGYISSTTLDGLNALLNAIQTFISEFQTTPSTYHAMSDSIGNFWDNAQIHSMDDPNLHKTNDGYVATLVVHGIVQGMPNESTS